MCWLARAIWAGIGYLVFDCQRVGWVEQKIESKHIRAETYRFSGNVKSPKNRVKPNTAWHAGGENVGFLKVSRNTFHWQKIGSLGIGNVLPFTVQPNLRGFKRSAYWTAADNRLPTADCHCFNSRTVV